MSRSPLPLKERLAALAAKSQTQGPKIPSIPTTATANGRRRMSVLGPRWARRPSLSETVQDKIQEVMGRLIYQAGVDFETRPMVVINASALPDPHEVSYDLLLSRILSYLNLYVESDYTVVFFAAGGRHTPGWNWIWKAYRSLGRSYRKHLKSLYIVHSSFFTKMLFSLAGALISPKFFRKIEYIGTLSELAYHVPLTQIDIPPAVYQENLRQEPQIRLPVPTRRDVFGVPLEELMGWDGERGGVPRVIRDAVQFLREGRLEDDGLFRRSPNSALLRQVKEAYDRGHVVNLETFGDSHLAAVLIKKFLRDLPEPIFPESLYGAIHRCPPPSGEPGDVASVTYIREVLLPQLPQCAYVLLSCIMQLLHEVSLHSDLNRMDANNLTIVIAPNLVKSPNPVRDVQMCAINGGSAGNTTLGTVLVLCISRYYECFEELYDRSEAIPPTQSTDSLESSQSSTAPDSDWAFVSSASGSASGSWTRSTLAASASSVSHDESAFGIGEDEDDEDHQGPRSSNPPSAWSGSGGSAGWKPRHSTGASRSSMGSRLSSTSASTKTGGSSLPGTMRGRARSTVSVETNPDTLRSSISVGSRGSGGTVRSKLSGAGVEAVGVTAAGFFSAPEDTPPAS